MDLIVCLKQVPDTESQIKVGDDHKSINESEIKWVMNPYDEFGVEEALKIKEAHGGTVTLVSVGPARATEALRTALAMGADAAVLVDDEAAGGGDSFATAKVLAAAIKGMAYDIIFCGQRAVDDDRGQVGAALAEFLDLPQVSVINKVEIEEGAVVCERPVEGGVLVIKSPLPVVLTAQKGLNEPRYASLPGIMKAKKKPLEVKKLADLGLDPAEAGGPGSKVEVLKMIPTPQRQAGQVIEGETPQEKAEKLAELLHSQAKVV